jgi:replication initiation protein RepC
MALGVASLERRQVSARERLENLLAEIAAEASKSVNPDPLGAENGPHQYTYKTSPDPEQDTVLASEESSRGGAEANEPPPAPVRPEPPEQGRVLKLAPDELVRLAPRLKAYSRHPGSAPLRPGSARPEVSSPDGRQGCHPRRPMVV